MRLLLIISSIFSFNLYAECLNGDDIRYISGVKTVSLGIKFCTSNRFRLLSQNCLSMKCKAYNGYRAIQGVENSVLQDQTGNPFDRRCQVAGGAPMLIEYKSKDKWKNEGICLFKEDNSFISTTADI